MARYALYFSPTACSQVAVITLDETGRHVEYRNTAVAARLLKST